MSYTKINHPLKSKSRTVTLSNGTEEIGLKYADAVVVAVTAPGKRCIPYVYNGWWFVTVCEYNMTLSTGSVTVTADYVER